MIAHGLTGLRLLAALPFALLMARDGTTAAWGAAALLALAIATDLLDGPIARRAGSAGAFGRAFDHASDFLFVTSGLLGGALRGAFPLVLPLLIAAAFAQYVVDSYWLHRQRELRMSALGRWNGILYFVPLAGDLLVRTGVLARLSLEPLGALVAPIAWALVASTAASIVDRALAAR